MAYSQLPTRTTADTNNSADINQLQLNLDAIKGGTGSTPPTTTIEELATGKATASGTLTSGDIITGAGTNTLQASGKQIETSLTNSATKVPTSSAVFAQLRATNFVINGGFTINQRGYTTGSALGAGAYGHDRWKGGAGGGTYTFSGSTSPTTITITDGTLQQVIEGASLESGTVILSWEGTATARFDSGSYAASPITTTATAGTNLTIEFGTGTVSKVMLYLGAVAYPWQPRQYADELALCQRYYEKSYNDDVAPGTGTTVGAVRRCFPPPVRQFVEYKVPKRISTTNFRVYDSFTGTIDYFFVHGGVSTNVTAYYNHGKNGAGFFETGLGSYDAEFHWVADADF
jgi:hypothetical protein